MAGSRGSAKTGNISSLDRSGSQGLKRKKMQDALDQRTQQRAEFEGGRGRTSLRAAKERSSKKIEKDCVLQCIFNLVYTRGSTVRAETVRNKKEARVSRHTAERETARIGLKNEALSCLKGQRRGSVRG